MVTLVIGGSGSGKSAYAESLLEDFPRKKYYLATMQVYDEEGRRKVEKHRRCREGKNFCTIEQPRDVARILDIIGAADAREPVQQVRVSGGTVQESARRIDMTAEVMSCTQGKPGLLLECVSNLTANEMFAEEGQKSADWVSKKILSDIKALLAQLGECVIVTNNVFEDGIRYDDATTEYLDALGLVNQGLAEMADRVVEVVVGIPIRIK